MLLMGFGAGLSWGACLMKWGGGAGGRDGSRRSGVTRIWRVPSSSFPVREPGGRAWPSICGSTPRLGTAFAEAGDVLGWDIGELCRHGSMEELTRTDRTQLAVLTCSVAAWRVLDERASRSPMAAGHSLGEYSALVAAGNLSFADALHVVDDRGRAMQACAERARRDDGGGHRPGRPTPWKRSAPRSPTSGWPTTTRPGQIVISGSVGGGAGGRRGGHGGRGAKRVVPLPVAGAFHTPLMAGAAEALAQALV